MLRGTGDSGTAYYSSENSNSLNRPKLSIIYTLGQIWHANETIELTGSNNESIFTKVLEDDESYLWNCYICDNSNNCGFYDGNYSLSNTVTSTTLP
jgi:hypothetical protein